MTNYYYGVFIGINECMEGYIAGRAGTQLYDPDDEAAKRLKNMLAGEMIDA